MAEPLVSVIVASYNAAETIGATLDSLANQQDAPPYEVIVVDSSTDGTGNLVAARHPEARLLRSRERLFPGGARNRGAALARGRILTFVDADCVVDSCFICEVGLAHHSEDPVIGGVILNGNPESYVGWGHYFAEFSQWMPQRPTVDIEVPAGALSVKKWAFDAYGPFLEGTYCSDTAFYWRLRRDGHTTRLNPRIRIAHTCIDDFGTLMRKEVFHGRSFARVRTMEREWSASSKALHAVTAPILPLLLFSRIVGRVVAGEAYRRQFAMTFPMVFLCVMAWSWGELLAYLPARIPNADVLDRTNERSASDGDLASRTEEQP